MLWIYIFCRNLRATNIIKTNIDASFNRDSSFEYDHCTSSFDLSGPRNNETIYISESASSETSETNMFYEVQDNKENIKLNNNTQNTYVSTPRKQDSQRLQCPISPIAHQSKSRASFEDDLLYDKKNDKNVTKPHSSTQSKVTVHKRSLTCDSSNERKKMHTTNYDSCKNASDDNSVLGSILSLDSDLSVHFNFTKLSAKAAELNETCSSGVTSKVTVANHEPIILSSLSNGSYRENVISTIDISDDLNKSDGKKSQTPALIDKVKYNLSNTSNGNKSNSDMTTQWNSLVVNEPSNRVIDFTSTQSTLNQSTSSDSLCIVEVPKKRKTKKEKISEEIVAFVSKFVKEAKAHKKVQFDTLSGNDAVNSLSKMNKSRDRQKSNTAPDNKSPLTNSQQCNNITVHGIYFFIFSHLKFWFISCIFYI